MNRFRNEGATRAQRRLEMDVMEFRVACGDFIGIGDVGRTELERPGKALVPPGIPHAKGMFTVRARGDSMLPKIRDGDYCMFHPDVVGTRQDRYVLVEDRGKNGGDRYTLKKYHSVKVYRFDGTWLHDKIQLHALNAEHDAITLEENGTYAIRGWYVGRVSQIERVDLVQYPDVDS